MGPRRVVPFDLLPVALSILGGIGPEGAKGLRALLGPRVLHAFPRMSRAVVFWSVRSILDAHGLSGMPACRRAADLHALRARQRVVVGC